MDANDAVTQLIGGLHDEREGLRQFALRRIVNFGSQAIPALIETLGDNKEYTQECAAIALTTFNGDSIPFLLEAMKNHPNRRVRWGAAWVLSAMGPEARKVVPAVTMPVAADTVPRPKRQPSEMWSDSWLTKIREQLNAARGLDAVSLGGAQC
jgi:HEAT repeat protein